MKWPMKIISIATYEMINKPIKYFSTKYENAVNLIRLLISVKIKVSFE